MAGRRSTAVARRGKYLLIGLEGGRTLALHLRMTGNLLLRDPHHGETADLMKSDRLGGPRLYEPAPSRAMSEPASSSTTAGRCCSRMCAGSGRR